MAGDLPAKLVFTVSNNSKSGALERTRNIGVPAFHVSSKTEGSEEGVSARLLKLIEEHPIDLLVLAGYMKKIPTAVLNRLKNRVVNIHPALLPEFGGEGFYGPHVHEAVVSNRRPYSGMTVHMVNENYDEGQILLQRRVVIPPEADAEKVGQLVLEKEHDSYWRVLKAFAEGDIVPTESDDPSQAARVDPAWLQRMHSLDKVAV